MRCIDELFLPGRLCSHCPRENDRAKKPKSVRRTRQQQIFLLNKTLISFQYLTCTYTSIIWQRYNLLLLFLLSYWLPNEGTTNLFALNLRLNHILGKRASEIYFATTFPPDQRAPRPSEHPSVRWGNISKRFRWDQRLQIQSLFVAFKRVPRRK